jgi:hypothetical protein
MLAASLGDAKGINEVFKEAKRDSAILHRVASLVAATFGHIQVLEWMKSKNFMVCYHACQVPSLELNRTDVLAWLERHKSELLKDYNINESDVLMMRDYIVIVLDIIRSHDQSAGISLQKWFAHYMEEQWW